MSTADTFVDYIQSNTNIKLLRSFAFEKLKKEWIKTDTLLYNIIDDNLLDVVKDFCKRYKHWSLTSENIGTVNIEIFKELRMRIKRIADSMIQEPKETIRESFYETQKDETETNTYERSYDFLHDKYLNTWK